jgi:hypothetical protein
MGANMSGKKVTHEIKLPISLTIILGVLAFAISACSTGVSGERVMGRKESPMWFRSASRATIISHFSDICRSYGFEAGTERFSECLQETEAQSRAAANARANSSNAALQNSLQKQKQPTFCTTTVSGSSTIATGVTQCY